MKPTRRRPEATVEGEAPATGAVPETSAGVRALTAEILRRHGEAARAVVFYGSCLRRGDDEGLVDLYLLVDRYRSAYPSRIQALLNKLLPPNVFYLETPVHGRVARAKYAVISVRDFEAGTRRWFHSYLWGRFAQPAAVLYARDRRTEATVRRAFRGAAVTFVERVLPQLPPVFETRELWRRGLELSYRAELRPEGSERAAALVDAAPQHFEQTTQAVCSRVRYDLERVDASGPASRYRARIRGWQRHRNSLGWGIRIVQGKVLSILRLLKAAATFQGGVEYALWKVQRHSGVAVEISPRLRRHPILAACVLAWRTYRRGGFR